MEVISLTRGTHKTNAVLTGVCFIMAAVTSIIGLKLYTPVLINEDYLIRGSKEANTIVLGAVLELMLACSAVGTSILLYPYLKKYNESLGLGYVCFRMLEVVFILVGTISVLALLSLSSLYTATNPQNLESFTLIGAILRAIHDWTFMLGPNFMLAVNTFIYSYVFYRSELIPVKLSLLGITGAIFIFIAAILEMFGIIPQLSIPGLLLALPIFTYEMTLAIWLMTKGFNTSSISNTQTRL